MSDPLPIDLSMRTLAHSALARRLVVLASALLAGACFDASVSPTALVPSALSLESRIDCVGSIASHRVDCAPAAPAAVVRTDARTGERFTLAGPLHDVILGNQGGYVKLVSSAVSAAAGVFSFDVRLVNLIAQPIGTTDGVNAAPSGSRVFFVTGPTVTSAGGGTVDFVNGGGFFHDGVHTFTASNQPYFQYVQRLNSGDTSAVKRWSLRYDPVVATFSFSLYVSTPVQYQNGYIAGHPNVLTLNPSEASNPLGGTVRSAVGNPVGGTISYVSSSPSIASVDAGGVVTGGLARGIAFISLSSGSAPVIPHYYTTAINICTSTPTIISGATVNGAIDVNDCYSSFAGNNDRPEPNFRSDLFRVSLTAGQQIAVTMTTGDVTVPALSLANPLGLLEAEVNGTGNTASIGAGAPVQHTGIYTIEAGQSLPFDMASQEPGYTGTYSLTVTVSP